MQPLHPQPPSMCRLRECVNKAKECVVVHRQHHLDSYPDLPGRSASYLTKGCLPDEFMDLKWWPTHARGKGWTRRALLTLLSHLFELPDNVPRGDWAAFKAAYLSSKCMVARKASVCGLASPPPVLQLNALLHATSAAAQHVYRRTSSPQAQHNTPIHPTPHVTDQIQWPSSLAEPNTPHPCRCHPGASLLEASAAGPFMPTRTHRAAS